MKKNEENLYFWVTNQEAEKGASRTLSDEEIRYLQNYNWIRLVKLSTYLFLLVFAVLGLLFLSLMFGSLIEVEGYSIFIEYAIKITPALLIIAVFIYVIRDKIPWKVKLWLSSEDLKAVEISGYLGTSVKEIINEENTWFINNTPILMPEHWENHIASQYPQKDTPPKVTIWAVERKDTTNRAYSYISTSSESLVKFKNLFQDYSFYALSCGKLSMDNDAKGNIPFFRASYSWMGLGMFWVLIGAFISIYLSIQLEDNNQYFTQTEQKIIHLENELNIGTPINSSNFSARGITTFSNSEKYGNQVLVSNENFDYYDVKTPNNNRHFILTPAEYYIIRRVSLVLPNIILSYQKASEKHLNDYKKQIKSTIDNSNNVPESIKNRVLEKLNSISNTVLEQQMRNLGRGHKANQEYVQHFLPSPMLYLPSDKYRIAHNCINASVFCKLIDKESKISGQNMAIVHDQSMENGAANYKIIYAQQLVTIEELKQELTQLTYNTPFRYWTQGLGLIGVLIILVGVLFIVSTIQANMKIEKLYDKRFV